MKLNKGAVFKIRTILGFGYLQYIETDSLGIDFIRILEPILVDKEITQLEINQIERWNAGFILKAAVKKKIIEFIGDFEIPESFIFSEYARTEHNVRGEFIGWHIIHKPTLKRELKKKLSENDIKLSPFGVMNDTLIIDKLESDWRLTDWK